MGYDIPISRIQSLTVDLYQVDIKSCICGIQSEDLITGPTEAKFSNTFRPDTPDNFFHSQLRLF
jgi:hypothetical protein